MLRVVICDNEAASAEWLEGVVRGAYNCDVSVYANSAELARDIGKGVVFDLYLLEVVMTPPDGIALAHLIRENDGMAAIIYLTTHEGRALEAFSVCASQYLIKPVNGDVILREIDDALAKAKARKAGTFLIKTKDGARAIPIFKIVYCKKTGRNLCCVTTDGEKYTSVTTRTPFETVIAKLLDDGRFFRCHISYVANMEYVSRIKGGLLEFTAGGTVPISRSRRAEFKKKHLQQWDI